MKTRKIAAALCALAMAVSLSACGNSDSGSGSTDKSAETTKAAETFGTFQSGVCRVESGDKGAPSAQYF